MLIILFFFFFCATILLKVIVNGDLSEKDHNFANNFIQSSFSMHE